MPQPTLMELVQKSAAWLQGKGIANGRREAEWIFSETLSLSRLELYTRFDMPLSDAEVDRLRGLVARRGKREPLAYLLGNQPFRGLKLTVTPDVLVPRSETEELVDLVLKDLPTEPVRILDIGTGSGAIALALQHARPGLLVEATEVSAAALAIARGNAERLALAVTFHQGHLANRLPGPYGVVVANLPYVGETERHLCDPELAHEPAQALFSGADGLDLIRELLGDLRRIAPGGIAWLEHGFAQAAAIAALAAQHDLTSTVHRDSANHERFTRVVVPA